MDIFRITEDVIFIHPELPSLDSSGVITFLCDMLQKKGIIDESYCKSVIEREKSFPTGLPTLPYAIALPHAENSAVKETAIALAILRESVKFKAMDFPENDLDVKLVLLMAFAGNVNQVSLLQWISILVQDRENVNRLVLAKTPVEVMDILKPYIQKQVRT